METGFEVLDLRYRKLLHSFGPFVISHCIIINKHAGGLDEPQALGGKNMNRLLILALVTAAGSTTAPTVQAQQQTRHQMRVHCTASPSRPVGGGVADVTGSLSLTPIQPGQFRARGTLDIALYMGGRSAARFMREHVRGALTYVSANLNGISLGAPGNPRIRVIFMDLSGARDRSYVEYEGEFYMMNCVQTKRN